MKAGKHQSWKQHNSAVAYVEHSLTMHNPLFLFTNFN